MQLPTRHAVEDPHVSPRLRPHFPSAVLHAALTQTAVPTAALHVPSSGGVWPEMLGMAVPFSSLPVHAEVCVLQNCVDEQSASTAQPPAATQTVPLQLFERHCAPAVHGPPLATPHFESVASHAADRQTVAALPLVQVPLPLAKPHALSLVSQTAAEHTAVPTAALHVPVSGGV